MSAAVRAKLHGVEHAFGRSAPFTVGIEEEFQLLSAESYELVPRFDEVAEAAGDERIRPELMTSVLETATGVHETVAAAIDEVREIRALLRDAAAARGALIASAGTHPFSHWEHQQITDKPRYQGVVDELRWVAEQVAIFGLHVHVAVPTADVAMQVVTSLRTNVPELLAVGANSPFWQARETGLASTRSKVFDTMPRSGLPPALGSFEEFAELVGRGMSAGFFDDYTYLWWDVRPHPKLGTVELRAFDAQTRVESVAALAALAQSLAATYAESPLDPQPRALIAENRWRAVRYGLESELVDLRTRRRRPARDAVRELAETAAPAAERLGCADELAGVAELLQRGNGADEQRSVHEEDGSLLAVAQWLAATTVEDL
ncbi:MAG: YbdK family carboxylate-amine ligase [Actinobacteria bacterium]|nr:MAG: YbdK family carboxylate-amine ligase [Actinomycetota bacterium]